MIRDAALALRRAALGLAALAVATMVSPREARAERPTSSLDRCLSASSEGQKLRDDGHYLDARSELRTCANDACPAIVRQNCEKWLRDLESALPTVVLALRRADGSSVVDASISVDGAVVAARLTGTPLPLDPGEHRFVLKAEGAEVEHRTLVLAGQKNRAIVLTLPGRSPVAATPAPSLEPPPRSGPPAASLALGGVGALALGTFAYVGLTAKSDLRALEGAPCAAQKTCDPAETDSIRARFLVADLALAAGVVAVGAAVTLWITDTRARVQVTRGPGLTALSLVAPIP